MGVKNMINSINFRTPDLVIYNTLYIKCMYSSVPQTEKVVYLQKLL